MNRKSMIVTGTALVLLLGGAAGSYFYVDSKKDAEEAASKAEQDALNLFTFTSADINAIDITNKDAVFHMTMEQNGDWRLDDTDYPYTFTLNSYYLNVIVAQMSSLKADHKAEDADLSKYGLDTPVTLSLHSKDNKEYTLLVGKSSATNEFCYVKLPDDDSVFCIENNLGTYFQSDTRNLWNPKIVESYDSDIEGFSVEHNGEMSYDLVRGNASEGQSWIMTAPKPNILIDGVTVSSVLTTIARVEAEELMGFTRDTLELAKYGLDKPAYTFTYKSLDMTGVLQFSEFSEDGTEIWGYNPDTCAVFKLNENSAAFLTGKWQDLAAKQVMLVPFGNVSSLDITIEGEEHKLSVDHENGAYTFDDKEIKASESEDAAKDFEYLYAAVSEIKRVGFTEDIPEKMGEAACTFSYTLTDGSKRELVLVPFDDENYLAYVDGETLGMTVSKTAVSGENGCTSYIEALKK